MPELILASSSPYRRALLGRLGLEFRAIAPGVDETPLPGEPPEATVRRLSVAKAEAVAAQAGTGLVVASDQVGVLDGRLLTKPGSVEGACAQLGAAAGREVEFLTGLCVLDAASGRRLVAVERCTATFRPLSEAAIRDYVARERPLDCAGSFKIEGLGIALFRSLELRDPTALEGLPLIRLTAFLQELGVEVLGAAAGSPG